jgi:hypothetical protein
MVAIMPKEIHFGSIYRSIWKMTPCVTNQACIYRTVTRQRWRPRRFETSSQSTLWYPRAAAAVACMRSTGQGCGCSPAAATSPPVSAALGQRLHDFVAQFCSTPAGKRFYCTNHRRLLCVRTWSTHLSFSKPPNKMMI